MSNWVAVSPIMESQKHQKTKQLQYYPVQEKKACPKTMNTTTWWQNPDLPKLRVLCKTCRFLLLLALDGHQAWVSINLFRKQTILEARNWARAHTWNPNVTELEARGWQTWSEAGLHSETLSRRREGKEKETGEERRKKTGVCGHWFSEYSIAVKRHQDPSNSYKR